MKRHKRLLTEINERISHPPYDEITVDGEIMRRNPYTPLDAWWTTVRCVCVHPYVFRRFACGHAGWVIPPLLDAKYRHPKRIKQ